MVETVSKSSTFMLVRDDGIAERALHLVVSLVLPWMMALLLFIGMAGIVDDLEQACWAVVQLIY